MKKLLIAGSLLVMTALSVHDFVLMAQAVMTAPGRYVSASEWKNTLDNDKPALGAVAGQAARIVPPFLIRRRLDGPNNASIHSKESDGQDVTEVYYILDGTGTYTTGGTIPDPKNRSAGIKGGQTNNIGPGDVIVIPPGTAHWFSKINGHITCIEARFPGDVTKVK